MSSMIQTVELSDLEAKGRVIFDYDALHIMVVKLDRDIYAFESMCSHAMFELDDGEIVKKDCAITCPLHGAHFCMKTGEALTGPAYEPIRIFQTQVVDDKVHIFL